MLERICPHLAMIGIHKNGTWAAQKIIECVTSPDEIALIAQNLRAYAPPLLLDQFGNYVIQYVVTFLSIRFFIHVDVIDAACDLAPLQTISSSTLSSIVCGRSHKADLEPAV